MQYIFIRLCICLCINIMLWWCAGLAIFVVPGWTLFYRCWLQVVSAAWAYSGSCRKPFRSPKVKKCRPISCLTTNAYAFMQWRETSLISWCSALSRLPPHFYKWVQVHTWSWTRPADCTFYCRVLKSKGYFVNWTRTRQDCQDMFSESIVSVLFYHRESQQTLQEMTHSRLSMLDNTPMSCVTLITAPLLESETGSAGQRNAPLCGALGPSSHWGEMGRRIWWFDERIFGVSTS